MSIHVRSELVGRRLLNLRVRYPLSLVAALAAGGKHWLDDPPSKKKWRFAGFEIRPLIINIIAVLIEINLAPPEIRSELSGRRRKRLARASSAKTLSHERRIYHGIDETGTETSSRPNYGPPF